LGEYKISSLEEIRDNWRKNQQMPQKTLTKSGEKMLLIEHISDICFHDIKFDNLSSVACKPRWVINKPTPSQQIIDPVNVPLKLYVVYRAKILMFQRNS
jgi:hypothetical protein